MTEFAMHGHGVRGMHWETLQSLNGHGDPGKFGRMFPKLDPLNVDDDILLELARAMKEPGDPGKDPDPAGDNRNIPAGFTYFGQFVDHDITLDTTPLDQQKADPLATRISEVRHSIWIHSTEMAPASIPISTSAIR